jgi:hypothetical protein
MPSTRSINNHSRETFDKKKVIQFKEKQEEMLNNIRRKPAQVRTNVYVQPMNTSSDTTINLTLRNLGSDVGHSSPLNVHLSSLDKKVRQRVLASGLFEYINMNDERQSQASIRQGFALPKVIQSTNKGQDLVGRMAKNDQQFTGLMQDVFQNSMGAYSRSDLNAKRKERLRQHALGSSVSAPSLMFDDEIPNLYRKFLLHLLFCDCL